MQEPAGFRRIGLGALLAIRIGMVRPLRIHLPGTLYHVVSRGNNKQAIFADDEDYLRFLKMMAHALELQRSNEDFTYAERYATRLPLWDLLPAVASAARSGQRKDRLLRACLHAGRAGRASESSQIDNLALDSRRVIADSATSGTAQTKKREKRDLAPSPPPQTFCVFHRPRLNRNALTTASDE